MILCYFFLRIESRALQISPWTAAAADAAVLLFALTQV